jgi:hypothetical protein
MSLSPWVRNSRLSKNVKLRPKLRSDDRLEEMVATIVVKVVICLGNVQRVVEVVVVEEVVIALIVAKWATSREVALIQDVLAKNNSNFHLTTLRRTVMFAVKVYKLLCVITTHFCVLLLKNKFKRNENC